MLKRAFDVVVSILGLIVLSPVLLFIALAVKIGSPGPVLYRARRVGRGGEEFALLKYRSMVVDAASIGPAVTGQGDPRVTPVGRALRRTKMDELPQLINVLRGEMSLVGPRPEDPRYVAIYTPEQRRVLDVRPGITGLASLRYRNEEAVLSGGDPEKLYIEEVLPAKLAIELEYIENVNLGRDILIILRTVAALFR